MNEAAARTFLLTDLLLGEPEGCGLRLDEGSILILDERMPKNLVGVGSASGAIIVHRFAPYA
jgi:hypothetical protein